jgi:hypothetical protein
MGINVCKRLHKIMVKETDLHLHIHSQLEIFPKFPSSEQKVIYNFPLPLLSSQKATKWTYTVKCIYICMYVCKYVYMYVCMCVYVFKGLYSNSVLSGDVGEQGYLIFDKTFL